MNERLIDLDELVLRCRTSEAKAYIGEAVACYRAGAFRACIVATWVAVVFDFLSKLDELVLTGDQQATQKRQDFDDIRQRNDISAALRFERDVLNFAKDEFGFITPIEYQDFERLLNDRNRCAHPSMNACDEIYQPTAELARYHLHNAVAHLLQHPPVQGKAALDRLTREVSSEYFPTETEKAIQFFEQGPLSNPRDSLVRNFTILLIKSLLQENHQGTSYARHAAALAAMRQMHRTRPIAEVTIEQKVNDIIRKLDDIQFANTLLFLKFTENIWHILANDVQLKIGNFIKAQKTQELTIILPWLLDFYPLRDRALERVSQITEEDLAEVITHNPRPEFIDRAIFLYSEADSFNQANVQADSLILPLIHFFDEEKIQVLFKVASRNTQIHFSHQFSQVINKLSQVQRVSHDSIARISLKYYLENEFYPEVFIQVMEVDQLNDLLVAAEEPDNDIRLQRETVKAVLKRLNILVEEAAIELDEANSLINKYDLRSKSERKRDARPIDPPDIPF